LQAAIWAAFFSAEHVWAAHMRASQIALRSLKIAQARP